MLSNYHWDFPIHGHEIGKVVRQGRVAGMLAEVRAQRDKELSHKKLDEIRVAQKYGPTLGFAGSQLMGMGATGSTANFGATGGGLGGLPRAYQSN